MEKLLTRHGQLVSFTASPYNSFELKRKSLAHFAHATDAEKAARHFKQTSSIEELGGTKLFVQRLFNVKYSLPGTIFDLLYPTIEKLLVDMGGSVRYSVFDNGKHKSLSISGDDATVIASAKTKISPILKYDTVRDPNNSRAIWTRYTASSQFAIDMEVSGADIKGIWCDSRRQEIRVFGKNESERLRLAQRIISHCEKMSTQLHAVPIPQDMFEFILQNGRSVLDKLKLMSSCRIASLDLKHKALLIDGTPLQAKKALGCLSRIADQEFNPLDSTALCPVCFCPPDVDENGTIIQLSCKHVYCRDCFRAWLTGGNTCEFPITCLAGGCGEMVSLSHLSAFLPGPVMSTLLRSAVDNHVRQHHGELHFCVTPTCPGIYQVLEGQKSSLCSTCGISICNACGISHEGMTCARNTNRCPCLRTACVCMSLMIF